MTRVLCLGLAVLVLLGAGGSAGLARDLSTPTPPVHPKRGIASARYLASDPAKLSALHASWAYDWSATAPPHARSAGWVPMVWGSGSVTPSTTASLRAARRSGAARYLLGFNEPDQASQSNLTPAQAARLWPQLERTGLILGSPAPAVPTDGWLSRFMTLVRRRGLRVDFIAVHYYQDFTNPAAVSDLRQQLEAIHSAYHRPVWVTEIGAIDIRAWGEPMMHTPTVARALAYMRKLFAMLDGLRFIQRYAWFTDNCWSDESCRFSSLFDGRGRVTRAGGAFRGAG